MKKTMVYIVALTVVFSTLLAGCGEHRKDKPLPTNEPTVTMPPEPLPDVEDGVVNDTDGFITDDGQKPANPDTAMDSAPDHTGEDPNVSADPDVNAAANNSKAEHDGKRTTQP